VIHWIFLIKRAPPDEDEYVPGRDGMQVISLTQPINHSERGRALLMEGAPRKMLLILCWYFSILR
jgi:hypothetical protein